MAGGAEDTQKWSVTVDCKALAGGVTSMLQQVSDPGTPLLPCSQWGLEKIGQMFIIKLYFYDKICNQEFCVH